MRPPLLEDVLESFLLPQRGTVTNATIVINPDRPGRLQPRLVNRRPLGYSRMTRPRGELQRGLHAHGWGVT